MDLTTEVLDSIKSMFLTTFIFIVTILFLPPTLTGQSNLTLLDNGTLPQESKALILQGRMVGYWGKHQIVLQNNPVLIPENEQVINVLTFNNREDNYLLAITIEKGPIPGEVNVHYRSLDTAGSIMAQWSQPQSNDVGLPEIHLVSNDYLFLHPEDQTVEIFSLSGENIRRLKLFPHSRWNHERKLIYLPNKKGETMLVGMATADLRDPPNTRLFQIDSRYQIKLKTTVSLTVPYIAELSSEGQLLIIGTQSAESLEKQIPYLLVYDTPDQPPSTTYRIEVIPYFARWWQGNVLLVFQNYLSLIDPDNPVKEEIISTNVSTFPLYTIVTGNRCYLFTSDEIQYQSQGLQYKGLRYQVIDLRTGVSQTQSLFSSSYSQVLFFPSGDEKTLGIQLDHQVYLYELK